MTVAPASALPFARSPIHPARPCCGGIAFVASTPSPAATAEPASALVTSVANDGGFFFFKIEKTGFF